MSEAFPPLPLPPLPPTGGAPIPPPGWSQPAGEVLCKASFWQRFAAWLVDVVLLFVAGQFITALVPGGMMLGVVGAFVYWTYFEGVTGQTLGKTALNIKIIDPETGDVIGYGRGVGRYFSKIVSGLAIGLGFFWMLWDPQKQTWHDKLVRSVVVAL